MCIRIWIWIWPWTWIRMSMSASVRVCHQTSVNMKSTHVPRRRRCCRFHYSKCQFSMRLIDLIIVFSVLFHSQGYSLSLPPPPFLRLFFFLFLHSFLPIHIYHYFVQFPLPTFSFPLISFSPFPVSRVSSSPSILFPPPTPPFAVVQLALNQPIINSSYN